MPNVSRCGWARTELSIPYHDTEWGVPLHDDRRLFEFLILEGAQAGLSWETIFGNGKPIARRSTTSIPSGSRATRQRSASGSWPTPGSCVIA